MSVSVHAHHKIRALAAPGLRAVKMHSAEVFSTEAWSLWIPEPSMLMSGTGKSSDSCRTTDFHGKYVSMVRLVSIPNIFQLLVMEAV